MGVKQRHVVFFLILMLAFGRREGWAAEPEQLIEVVGTQGYVNWSAGTIVGKGQGAPPEKYYGTPQARSLALKAAQLDACRNLLEVIRGVRIESESTVGELMALDDMVEAQVREMVKCAEIAKREYLSDGTVEVSLSMSLYGGFAQLVLPRNVKQLPEIKTIAPAPKPSAEAEPPDALKGGPLPKSEGPRVYSGLVIDAQGLGGRAAMSPKLFDENGEEVYGPAYVSREFAVQHGMATYARALEAEKIGLRVSDKPLAVKGLRTTVAGGCDFVISNSDAAKMRSSSENLSLLRECRVAIILD